MKWQASMIARKQFTPWNYVEDEELRARMAEALPAHEERKRDAALKDAHLLEAAEATGKRVISRDAAARGLFQGLCAILRQYGALWWGDLTSDSERTRNWVKAGFSADDGFRLCPLRAAKAPRKQAKRG